jgi:hypothetical protein
LFRILFVLGPDSQKMPEATTTLALPGFSCFWGVTHLRMAEGSQQACAKRNLPGTSLGDPMEISA